MTDLSDTRDKYFQVITSAHDDCRRQIAAGKVQRWDVFKWGVAVNVALTAASALGNTIVPLFWLAISVALASLLLIEHYNRRMTGARQKANILANRLKSFNIDYDALLKTDVARAYSAGEDYDCVELLIFNAILVVSAFLVFLKGIISAAAITDNMAHGIGWFLAALATYLLSQMLSCLSSLAQFRRATRIDAFLRRHAVKVRWLEFGILIISVTLFMRAAIVAAIVVSNP
jgi:hypothetical protein